MNEAPQGCTRRLVGRRRFSLQVILAWLLIASTLSSNNCNCISAVAVALTPPPLLAGHTAKSEFLLRGGDTSSTATTTVSTKKKKKKSRKKKKKKRASTDDTTEDATPSSSSSSASNKQALAEALQQDSAEALGDAVKAARDDWRQTTLASVGTGVGSVAPDRPPASPVLVSYFLHSHGGAHALQSAASLLATLSALACLLLPARNQWVTVLLSRTLVLALTKYVAGLVAATAVAGRAVPRVGWRRTAAWMQRLADDPVAQYAFYTATLRIWLPWSAEVCWWQERRWCRFLVLGPVLLREAVSTAWVLADVLILLSSLVANQEVTVVHRLAGAVAQVLNALLSLWVTPAKWRGAPDAASRQAILAQKIGQVSLFLEVAVGLLMITDCLVSLTAWTVGVHLLGLQQRPAVTVLLKRCFCTHLFIHFLYQRKRQVTVLATELRGGALQFPMYVMQVLMNPLASLGLTPATTTVRDDTASVPNDEEAKEPPPLSSWQDYVRVALGMDDDDDK